MTVKSEYVIPDTHEQNSRLIEIGYSKELLSSIRAIVSFEKRISELEKFINNNSFVIGKTLNEKWISVNYKLPHNRTNCLVYLSTYDYCVCYYDDDSWNYYHANDITHWMPLPERPYGT